MGDRVDQHRRIAAAPGQRDVVDTEHVDWTNPRIGEAVQRPQQCGSAGYTSQPGGQP
jgi:hypothetical protein